MNTVLLISKFFILFIASSMFGYLYEVVYSKIVDRHLTFRRGFLSGPICPVYGVGGLAVYFLLNRFNKYPVVIFLLSVVIVTVIEYLVAELLWLLYRAKWWDYSNFRLQFQGKVALVTSMLFGWFSLFGIYVLYPLGFKVLDSINYLIVIGFASLLLMIFVIDFIVALVQTHMIKDQIKNSSGDITILAHTLKKKKMHEDF